MTPSPRPRAPGSARNHPHIPPRGARATARRLAAQRLRHPKREDAGSTRALYRTPGASGQPIGFATSSRRCPICAGAVGGLYRTRMLRGRRTWGHPEPTDMDNVPHCASATRTRALANASSPDLVVARRTAAHKCGYQAPDAGHAGIRSVEFFATGMRMKDRVLRESALLRRRVPLRRPKTQSLAAVTSGWAHIGVVERTSNAHSECCYGLR
jgi:hypothetical protein